jgi:indole-3-glycerol phosphate synthase
MAVKWLDEPEEHDYDAAADYLSLIAEADAVTKTVAALKDAAPTFRKAKDILRAATLVLLTESNVRVKGDLAKIAAEKRLSPILLVRGDFQTAAPLQIADGYHRVCASYLTDENTPIPCRLASWQPR